MSMEPGRDPACHVLEMEEVGGGCDKGGAPDEQDMQDGIQSTHYGIRAARMFSARCHRAQLA